jgi:hemerythrin-like domain-containing protein
VNDARERPSAFLGGDHDDLDRLFDDFRATPPAAAARRLELFGRFSADLRHHIAVEERLLFPAFGEGDPAHRRVVDQMLDEHRRIEGVLERIQVQLGATAPSTEALETELLNVLWTHNAREEEAVYPWFDSHLSVELSREVRQELRGHGGTQNAP